MARKLLHELQDTECYVNTRYNVLDNVTSYSTKLRNPTQVATMTTALDLGVNRRSEEKVLQGQDTIGSGSNLDRVPWVVSTVSCP